MKKCIAFLFLGIIAISCQTSASEEPLENLDKKSAREVTLRTITKGDVVYHLTEQNIWVNGERIAQKTDTIETKLQESTWSTDSTSMKLNEIPIYVTVQ